MAYEGYIDRASESELTGWIFDNRMPDHPLEIEILDGDKVIATMTAGEFRADLLAAGKGNGAHAFSYAAVSPPRSSLAARVAGKRWRIAPAGGYKAHHALPMRFDATLAHPLEYGQPMAIDLQGFSTAITVGEDAEIARRLLRAYHKTVDDNPDPQPRRNDQWASNEAEFHQEILALLKRNDAHGLMLYLRDAHARPLTHGITQGEYTTNMLRENADARQLVMLATLDHLTSLAEFLGLLDVECPDQHGQWAENIHADPLTLVDRITAMIGVQVVPPQVVGSSFGIRTGHGILATRDLLALYAALRIRTLVNSPGNVLPHGSVCEIGGGLGGAAYYANRLGLKQYTIIDLPLVTLLQGYFLIRALPEAKIALYGEEIPDAAIRLLPAYAFANLNDPFDLLFNQDSMPEMHPEYSLGYLRNSLAKKIPLFLSINQEARARQNESHGQNVVRELVAEATRGSYWCQHRVRHWLRAGYVEELYLLR